MEPKSTSFIERLGPKTSIKYVVLGGLYGFFIILPAVMMVAHLMLEPQLNHDHLEYEIIFLEVNNAFSIESLPWGLAFSFLGAVVGLRYGRFKASAESRVHEAEGYSKKLEKVVDKKSRELHESEELFKTIIETGSSAEVGVLLFNKVAEKDAIIRFANFYMLQLLGYKKKDLFRMSFYDLLRPKEVHKVTRLYQGKTEIGEPIPHFETEIVTKEGKVIPIIVGSAIAMTEEKLTTVAFIRNIKERKEAENALKNSYEELKTIDEVKDNIIMNVSHELRTPITIAMSHIELAADEDEDSERQEQLTRAKKALMRQVGIINNLLDIARIKKRKFWLNLEEINLGDVASMVVGEMKTLALYKGIKIERDITDISLKGDFSELMRVFSNLLDNSIKFTEKGGIIKISSVKENDKVKISVEDSGIGIPHEFHERVFERLFQVDATATRKYGGAGIGLSVVHDIVEAHGGKVWCEDRPQGGVIFYFTLPIAGPGETPT